MKFLAAWRFLTIIPLPFRRENTEAEITGSLVYFPVVGLIIGIILAGLGWLLNLFLPQLVVAILLVIALTSITAAMHIDGLADTLDGLGGKDTEERLHIMRDSHHGSYGIVGIVVILLLKVITLSTIPEHWILLTLIAFPVVGRWTMVYCITIFSYVRPSGLGTLFKKSATLTVFIMTTLLTLIVVAFTLHGGGVIIMALVLFMVIAVSSFFNKQFGGFTGDNYGAINEIAEGTFMLLVVLFSYRGWFLT